MNELSDKDFNLSSQELEFVHTYLQSLDSQQAALKAGYTEQQGRENLGKLPIILTIFNQAAAQQLKTLVPDIPVHVISQLVLKLNSQQLAHFLKFLNEDQLHELLKTYQKALEQEDYEALEGVSKIEPNLPWLLGYTVYQAQTETLNQIVRAYYHIRALKDLSQASEQFLEAVRIFNDLQTAEKNRGSPELETYLKTLAKQKLIPHILMMAQGFECSVDDLPSVVSKFVDELVHSFRTLSPFHHHFERLGKETKDNFNKSLYFYKNLYYWLAKRSDQGEKLDL